MSLLLEKPIHGKIPRTGSSSLSYIILGASLQKQNNNILFQFSHASSTQIYGVGVFIL